MPAKDLLGNQYGYLTVIARDGSRAYGKSKVATWLCQCSCGTEVVRTSQYLRQTDYAHRHPRHCGCQHGNKTHGATNSPLYRAWSAALQRCYNPLNKDYKNWGARGIVVCKRWRDDFTLFADDVGPTWREGLSLGRIDNNGPYSPENSQWETVQQQSNNRRTNILLDDGRTVAQAAKSAGLKPSTVYARIRRGWDESKILMTC